MHASGEKKREREEKKKTLKQTKKKENKMAKFNGISRKGGHFIGK